MKYTIDAETREYEEFRLQAAGTWRNLSLSTDIMPGDLVIGSPEEVWRYKEEGVVVLDGEAHLADSELGTFVNPREGSIKQASTFPRLHRDTKPRRFTREELADIIASGDDLRYNVLALDVDGRFKLLNISFESYDYSWDPNVAAYDETYTPDGGNLGEEISQDKKHVNSLYLDFLRAWVEHLMTGKLNRITYETTEELEDMTEKELWEQVEGLF